MGDVITLNFPRETLIYNPNPSCFFYFEGPVQRQSDGFLALGDGMVLILYPVKGGNAQFLLSWPSQVEKINGLCQFRGTLELTPLIGGRTLRVKTNLTTLPRFYITDKGGAVREVPAVLNNGKLKLQVQVKKKVSHIVDPQYLAHRTSAVTFG